MLKRYDDILDNRGRRYEVNNMWTDVPAVDLVPSFHRIVKDLPPAPTHLYMMWWLPVKQRDPHMVFSMEARLYVALYAITEDASRDAQHSDYVVESLELMDSHRKGIQLADENLPMAPGRFMGTYQFRQLERLRQQHDPTGVFHNYIRLPAEFERIRSSL